MKLELPRNRFRRLIRPARRKPNYFSWGLWIFTAILFLQFFIPLALNSYEGRFKPDEPCPACLSGPGPARFCPLFHPTNRTCPDCGMEWSAPEHQEGLTPFIVLAVQALFRW